MSATEQMNEQTAAPQPELSAQTAEKLAVLMQLNRFDNVIDLLSLVSDLVDIIGKNEVNKLADNAESGIALLWESGLALNKAKIEMMYSDEKYNFRNTYKLLKDQDTLKGINMVLRTLQIMGSRIQCINSEP